MDLGELALQSERLIFGRTELAGTDPTSAKVLLSRPTQTPWGGHPLVLEPIRSESDWQQYRCARIAVERTFGIPETDAHRAVDELQARAQRLNFDVRFATASGLHVGAIAWFPVNGIAVRLQEIDVFPSSRGRGYGNDVLATTMQTLEAQRVQIAVVGADEDDWPLNWYRRHGFQDVARVPLTR